MKYLMLSAWIMVFTSAYAPAQVRMQWNTEERAFFDTVRNTINKAIPRLKGFDWQNWIFERSSFPTVNGIDTTHPFLCESRHLLTIDSTKLTSDNFVDIRIYINPQREAFSFDVTKDFEELSIDGVKHGIRGNQYLVQAQNSNSYGKPFTALFLGNFTMPYNQRFPQRERGDWGPDQFITTTTYSAYNLSKHYLSVQGIYIFIDALPDVADAVIEQIDFAELNGLITK